MKKPMMQMIVVLVLMLFFAAATLVLGQRRRAAESMKVPEGVKVYRDIAYVADGHERQKLDLYVPETGENLPLIIWIHGGAWRGGDKKNYIRREYLKAGYAGASLNYRLSQHAIFPAQIEDVKVAVRWLRANAETYRLDPNRFAAWGSSAGGHLVAMLGTAGDVDEFEVGENLEVSSRVQAVVDYFGPTDFLQMDAQSLPDGLVHDAPDSPESQLVGGPIQEHKDRVAKANPITYVSEDDSPFLIIHGDRDKLVPYQQSVLLKDALEKVGVPVTFYKVEGGGHGWFRDPKVPELTKAFLEQHLKPTQ
ncbi:MAG: alpha/beta hydrolase [Candidatus Poribacteria bacterium]|nr:alpha/beta hydrolase [Candidatus Poribacteria bacterium]